MEVLIVERSRSVAAMISAACARHGLTAHQAYDGAEGLAAIADGTVDLLCFSYELGDMNGIDFFRQARLHQAYRDIPAIMFSGALDPQLVTRALEAGITECLPKKGIARIEEFLGRIAHTATNRVEGRILLVEDSATAALFATRILQDMGLAVDHCKTAAEAADRFSRQDYDLVITDFVLAGAESGLAVIHAVRHATGRKVHTPILAVSGIRDAAQKVEILRSGANDFVQKPVLPEELAVRVRNLLLVHQMMQRLEAQAQAMQDMAMRDQLTGLHNRHYLQQSLPGLVAQAADEDTPFSLLMVDVDHFKRINDTHGHATGDEVLTAIADRLGTGLGAQDVAARFGGEEFILLLPGTALAAAIERAEALRRGLETLRPAGLDVTASIGVAEGRPGENWSELFRRADEAVYRAKEGGRNRVEADG